MFNLTEERFGVIADDVTGASDTGIQFLKHGFKTIVLYDVTQIRQHSIKDATVIVANTKSRGSPPNVAYRKVREAVKKFKVAKVGLIYKKMDSTLRGNIGVELDAIMNESGINLSIVAPAYPRYGRITVDGMHLINQIPVAKTEFSQDPVTPVTLSHIPTLLRTQMIRKVGHIPQSTVLDGRSSLEKAVHNKWKEGTEVIVIDATTERDLETIAQVSLALNALPCGSAGLANALAKHLHRGDKPQIFVVSGSVSETTMRQINNAKCVLNSCVVDLDTIKVLKDDDNNERETVRVINELNSALCEGKEVILRTTKSKDDVTQTQNYGTKLGLNELEVSKRLTSTIGNIVKRVLQRHHIMSLVLIGGDTALSVMNRIGAIGAQMIQELLPGIPVCRVIGGPFDRLTVVTKAGGFGSDDALIEIIKFLKGDV
jgi:uncharacterized protein YgbK (DUF1537 family)